MADKPTESIFKGVDLHSQSNNFLHHTSDISLSQLIVRRGQSFNVTLNLAKPFENQYPLCLAAKTGKYPTEEQGTLSIFSLPDGVTRSPSAKAVWKIKLNDKESSTRTGKLVLIITPPADSPIGEYEVRVKHREEETLLATLVVLFNPWCPDDWVYMKDQKEIDEYVMNEQGIIYRGSYNYIFPLDWDYGQFEENMVRICLKILDLNLKHLKDPADDVSARCNPIYVGRVISAMINCQDDAGVLEGCWDGEYEGGSRPGHWTGSYAILNQWFGNEYTQVRYGQCWVFAGVMCSVMRLLGIPCRVITNFESAHDNNTNLTIDNFYSDEGVRRKPTHDSVWNFHVWTESWMRRPDLSEDGKYDGWQVLDPTPQEKSEDVYCCGPAPVKAILQGETAQKYDVPFVFAEVNADCIDWLVKSDGSMVVLYSDTKKIGQNISTKAVGSERRIDITSTYKHKEGSDKERSVFKYATTRDYSAGDEDEEMEEEEEEEVEEVEGNENEENVDVEEVEEGAETEEETEDEGTVEVDVDSAEEEEEEEETTPVAPKPKPVIIKFEEVTPPTNGKAVKLRVVLQSKSPADRLLSINISVQAMTYTGLPAESIQTETKERTLTPELGLSIPIDVPFSTYHKAMVNCDSMKISVVVTDKEKPENIYLANDDVVLIDPPLIVKTGNRARVNSLLKVEVSFMNPTKETLKDCSLTVSGSGIWKEPREIKLADIKINRRIRVTSFVVPYKAGNKTIVADFDCSAFRDIKGRCTVNVKTLYGA